MLVKPATPEQKSQLQGVLDKCQIEASRILNTPVVIMYKLRINSINPTIVFQTVCSVLGITYTDVVGPNKKQEQVLARDLIAYLCVNYCGLSHEQAAAQVNRERSSITVALQKVTAYIQTQDELYTQPLAECERLLMNIVKEN